MVLYEYKMLQITALGVRRVGGSHGNEMATELSRVANQHATEGWEFYRVDEFTMVEGGCLNALFHKLTLGLFGSQGGAYQTHVITFRRQK